MSRWQLMINIEVDDEALAEHDGDAMPPPNDPDAWEARDLFLAADKGLVKVDESEIVLFAVKVS